MIYNYKGLVNLQLEAKTTEDSHEFDEKLVRVSSITNLGANDLYISFDKAIGNGDEYIILEEGDVFKFGENEEVECKELYFKSDTDKVKFQIVGFAKWGRHPNSYYN